MVSIVAHFAFFSVAAFCLKVWSIGHIGAKNHPEIPDVPEVLRSGSLISQLPDEAGILKEWL